jgi:hypothetical protein
MGEDEMRELRERGIYRLDGQEFIACAGDEGGYVLYTRTEWDSESTADYEVSEDGVVTFQGGATRWDVEDLIDTGADC